MQSIVRSRTEDGARMIPYKSPLLTAVPQTLEKRLEIIDSIRALAARDDDEQLSKRRAELASIRRELGELAQVLQEIRRDCDPRLRSYVMKYSSDQPRVPAGNPDGGQWTGEGGSGSSNDSSDASGDVSDDDSSDSSNGASGEGSEPGPQYAALDTGTQTDASEGVPSNSQTHDDSTEDRIELADAANDNLTPEQICQQAYSDGMTSARINPSLSSDEYLDARYQLTSALQLCLDLANGVRPISPGGNFVEFYGAGTVIFRQGIPPFYVPFPGRR